ncbi:MAG: Holliday junction branch migration protein RuvA [Candidatus Paceibacterota bacterium]|jgi:Holliday junction DNA helicase RuvA
MISYVKGQVILKKEKFVIVSTGNIGYKVFALSDSSKIGDTVEFFTYLNVREDALTLYGFPDYGDLELFEHLISVSGIGPKTALGVLSLADSRTIKIAIAKEDSSILTRVSGIGKKTAERIILELKNKFSISDVDRSEEKGKEISDHSDAFEALVSLGYSSFQAKKALSEISPEIKDVGERIKMALKELGRK